MEDKFLNTAKKVSYISIAVNLGLTLYKFVSGILGNSQALVSDAVHSASDVFSSIIVLIGIRFAAKEADEYHPYGYERFECVAAILLSFLLTATAVGIGYSAATSIIFGEYEAAELPNFVALVAAIVSIAAKEGMYWYTRYNAKKINSTALMADAWHHRSDSLSSVGALIGIAFSMFGFHIMDPIASLVIFVLIMKAAIEIFVDAINKMTDASVDKKVLKKYKDFINNNPDVKSISQIRTRKFGPRVFVDLEIALDKSLCLYEAEGIAKTVHDSMEKRFPEIKHIMVHVSSEKS